MTGQTQTAHRDRTGESEGRWRPVARRNVEASDEPVEQAIVSAVADAKGVDPAELSSRPLSDGVDLGALDESFFELGPDEVPGDVAGVVEFRYGEYRVTVSTGGDVDVAAPVSSRPTLD
jgi:hypothetical protein